MTWKLKFQKNFWMSFPEFANNGRKSNGAKGSYDPSITLVMIVESLLWIEIERHF